MFLWRGRRAGGGANVRKGDERQRRVRRNELSEAGTRWGETLQEGDERRLNLGFWLRLWEMFHRFMKTLTETLEQNVCLHSRIYLHVAKALRWIRRHLIDSHSRLEESCQRDFFSPRIRQTHFNSFTPLFLPPPTRPDSARPFRIDEQRPHLSAGQGKCLSHLLQETWSPQEMWRWRRGRAPGTGRPRKPEQKRGGGGCSAGVRLCQGGAGGRWPTLGAWITKRRRLKGWFYLRGFHITYYY